MAGNLIDLSESTFAETIKSASTPVLVDFWAPWCGPCRMLTPVLEQLATERAGKVTIAKVNIDDNPNLAAQFNVTSIPMMAFFKGGELKGSVVGGRSKDALGKMLDDL